MALIHPRGKVLLKDQTGKPEVTKLREGKCGPCNSGIDFLAENFIAVRGHGSLVRQYALGLMHGRKPLKRKGWKGITNSHSSHLERRSSSKNNIASTSERMPIPETGSL